MATIINHTEFQLTIRGVMPGDPPEKQFSYSLLASRPGEAKGMATVEDAHARYWTKRTPWLKRGDIAVNYGAGSTTVQGTPPVAEESGKLDIHWQKAVALIGEMSDVDELEKLHEVESRARVREAIELRMRALLEA